MKKLLLVFVFLISFIAVSFADLIPMKNGTYVFKTAENENITFIVISNSLKLVTEDGATYKMTLLVNKDGDYFYFCKNKEDDYIIVTFDNWCVAMIETSNDIFFLYNSGCKAI